MILDELNLTTRTLNALKKIDVTDLLMLTKWFRDNNRKKPVKPSEILDEAQGFGFETYKELFDAVLVWISKQEEKKTVNLRVNDQALSVLNTMLSSSTGDFGGRDSARLFAEIAFDYLDALATEERIRSTQPHQPPSPCSTPPAADSDPGAR